MTMGHTLNYGLLCQRALVILAQGFVMIAPGTLFCLKLPIPIQYTSNPTHSLIVLLYEPLAALKSVPVEAFCSLILNNVNFITALRLHI